MSIYVVKRGDSLFSIARRFGVTPETLAYINQINDPARLSIGRALAIPENASPGSEIEVNGYAYPNISSETLRETLPYLSYFCPFSCHADTAGNIISLDDAALVSQALAQNTAPLLTVTNIASSGGFSGEITHALFYDSAVQDAFFNNLMSLLSQKPYYGVNFNFEYIYPYDREGYNAFIRRAAGLLHASGYFLSTAITPKTSDAQPGYIYAAHDYAVHGEYCDRVILMTYEWGYTYSSPQAVSPVDRIHSVLSYAVTVIPPQKILLGFSNYGYVWTLPWQQGSAATVISNAAAANTADSVFAEIKYDTAAAAPWFKYTPADGKQREVWFEDVRSVKARLNLVSEFSLAGISFWTVNQLFRGGLEILRQSYNTEKIL